MRRKAVERAVGWLAAPGASESAKRELRNLLEIINDTGEPSSPDTWARASLGVIAPGGNPSALQKQAATALHRGLSLQVLAIRHLDVLCDPSTMPLWEWARVVDQKHRAEYVADQAVMAADPDVGHLYSRPLVAEIIQQGCFGLLTMLGIGLGVVWGEYGMRSPPGDEPPPMVTFKRR